MNALFKPSLLKESQIELASKMATRAFQEEPLFVYLYPDPIERKNKSILMHQNLILAGITSGEVYTTSSKIEGIAVWHPFGKINRKSRQPSKDIIKKSRKVRRELYSDRGFKERNAHVSEVTTSLHYKHADFPHWFLSFIAVDPLHQGKGYASKLIKAKLVEADQENIPCYLNTENEKKVPLYEHFGFELVEKRKISHSNLWVWGMLRKNKS